MHISLSLCVYIYIHINAYTCVYIYIYITIATVAPCCSPTSGSRCNSGSTAQCRSRRGVACPFVFDSSLSLCFHILHVLLCFLFFVAVDEERLVLRSKCIVILFYLSFPGAYVCSCYIFFVSLLYMPGAAVDEERLVLRLARVAHAYCCRAYICVCVSVFIVYACLYIRYNL